MSDVFVDTMEELTRAVKFLCAQHFPPGILRRALRLKLVEALTVFARWPLDLAEPLAIVRPGEQPPDYNAIAYASQKRLRPPKEFQIFRPTQRTVNIFGGSLAKINPLQAGHDAQVGGVLAAHRIRGINTGNWLGEHRMGSLVKLFGKLPDAIVVWKPMLAVEVVGDYSADRIKALVEAMMPYEYEVELW